ncbi:STE3-domain-containing protein [Byssothecium circinans]|uniref:STE3-domain-containing protein n=1 Tax=Byssothecium circinans TaxID=147558 RepID=A0A6A5TZM9_9PLEO|nr:STE3-domain-containing protein [Byssothecium circinans]
MTEDIYPLTHRSDPSDVVYPTYASAVFLPVIAFPATLLCVPPMIWHFKQRNVAAGSLMLWLTLINFFNAINPLIWPRDNVMEWWNGEGLCDIQVRIQVGAVVAFTSCSGVIARRLANVMDTRNITVAPSKRSRIVEKVLEIVCCWVIPLLIMIIYYVIQRVRYFIFAISGCVAAYDPSWPSVVLVWMWGPISTIIASYFAGLLIYRLYRYRREFQRLLAARNTSKSRFVRLFLMSVIFILCILPYQIFILYELAKTIEQDFEWSRVHGSDWNSVIKVPTAGSVRFDRWVEVVFGYILFMLFGTGTDAHNSYKRMLTSIGLGKFFPSLYIMRESGASTPASMSFIKGWTHKAKSLFSKGDTVDESFIDGTRSAASGTYSPTTARSMSLRPTHTNDPILPERPNKSKSLFSRVFGDPKVQQPSVLPVSTADSVNQTTASEKSPTKSLPAGVYAHAWSEVEPADRTSDDGVHIVHEVTQAHQHKAKDKVTDKDAGLWV